MNQSLKYGLSKGIRLFICSMAVFFIILAVFDGFVKKVEIVYSGEFVSEADYRFIELPNTLQFPSGSKITNLGKIEFIQLTRTFIFSVLEFPSFERNSGSDTVHIFQWVSRLLKFSLISHAP